MRLPRVSSMGFAVRNPILLGITAAVLIGGGCTNRSFFDQTEFGRFPKSPLIVPILDSLDTGQEEGDARFARATNVRASDLEVTATDYVITGNDMLQISIEGLVAPGVEYFRQIRVTETGNISLPYIGQIKAAGLTEAQLEQAIQQTYQDRNLIERANVSVTTLEARGRTFTVTGNVGLPGQYGIYEANFRLLDALALSRGVTSQGIENIYIIRQLEQEPDVQERAPNLDDAPATEPVEDILTPPQSRGTPAGGLDAGRRAAFLKTQAQPDDPAATLPQPADQPGEGRIIVIDGKEVQVGGPGEPMQPMEIRPAETDDPMMEGTGEAMPPATQPFEFDDLEEPTDIRVIRIPYEQLQRGEYRYNIVIRPKDMIIVPDPLIGEYYMGGHVARVGVYSLTARNITLTQAIISAGMLDQLAVPWRTQIRRRIGPNREIISTVNLSKIFAGQEPNIYMKPYDEVIVGTDIWAPFLAAARNGFRVTYGFGFLYDRNYAPDDDNF